MTQTLRITPTLVAIVAIYILGTINPAAAQRGFLARPSAEPIRIINPAIKARIPSIEGPGRDGLSVSPSVSVTEALSEIPLHRFGQLYESDILTFCTETSVDRDRNNAALRIKAALSLNAARLRTPRDSQDDVVEDTLLKILAACERLTRGDIKNLPGYVMQIMNFDVKRNGAKESSAAKRSVPLSTVEPPRHLAWALQLDVQPDLLFRDQLRRLAKKLTKRETDVLLRLSLGMNPAEVARDLKIGEERTREIIKQIRRKYTRLAEMPQGRLRDQPVAHRQDGYAASPHMRWRLARLTIARFSVQLS